jgi:hypothetical protein
MEKSSWYNRLKNKDASLTALYVMPFRSLNHDEWLELVLMISEHSSLVEFSATCRKDIMSIELAQKLAQLVYQRWAMDKKGFRVFDVNVNADFYRELARLVVAGQSSVDSNFVMVDKWTARTDCDCWMAIDDLLACLMNINARFSNDITLQLPSIPHCSDVHPDAWGKSDNLVLSLDQYNDAANGFMTHMLSSPFCQLKSLRLTTTECETKKVLPVHMLEEFAYEGPHASIPFATDMPTRLQSLELKSVQFTDVASWLNFDTFPILKRLSLQNISLCAEISLPSLHELDLSRNQIDDVCLGKLLDGLPASLRVLRLHGNQIKQASSLHRVIAWMESRHVVELKVDLSCNPLALDNNFEPGQSESTASCGELCLGGTLTADDPLLPVLKEAYPNISFII